MFTQNAKIPNSAKNYNESLKQGLGNKNDSSLDYGHGLATATTSSTDGQMLFKIQPGAQRQTRPGTTGTGGGMRAHSNAPAPPQLDRITTLNKANNGGRPSFS